MFCRGNRCLHGVQAKCSSSSFWRPLSAPLRHGCLACSPLAPETNKGLLVEGVDIRSYASLLGYCLKGGCRSETEALSLLCPLEPLQEALGDQRRWRTSRCLRRGRHGAFLAPPGALRPLLVRAGLARPGYWGLKGIKSLARLH
jgi:hypothetical protein